MRVIYDTTTKDIVHHGETNVAAGGGQTLVNPHTGTIPVNIPNRHLKWDTGTSQVIEKTAGEKTSADDAALKVTGAQIQTAYATKTTDADRITFLKDLTKLLVDNAATKDSVDAL